MVASSCSINNGRRFFLLAVLPESKLALMSTLMAEPSALPWNYGNCSDNFYNYNNFANLCVPTDSDFE